MRSRSRHASTHALRRAKAKTRRASPRRRSLAQRSRSPSPRQSLASLWRAAEIEMANAERERFESHVHEAGFAHQGAEFFGRRERGDRRLEIAILACSGEQCADPRHHHANVEARERTEDSALGLTELEDRNAPTGLRDSRHLAERLAAIGHVANAERH